MITNEQVKASANFSYTVHGWHRDEHETRFAHVVDVYKKRVTFRAHDGKMYTQHINEFVGNMNAGQAEFIGYYTIDGVGNRIETQPK